MEGVDFEMGEIPLLPRKQSHKKTILSSQTVQNRKDGTTWLNTLD